MLAEIAGFAQFSSFNQGFGPGRISSPLPGSRSFEDIISTSFEVCHVSLSVNMVAIVLIYNLD